MKQDKHKSGPKPKAQCSKGHDIYRNTRKYTFQKISEKLGISIGTSWRIYRGLS